MFMNLKKMEFDKLSNFVKKNKIRKKFKNIMISKKVHKIEEGSHIFFVCLKKCTKFVTSIKSL